MKFIADFHIHSKYSRATSGQTDLENISKWAEIKGVKVIATGDFTHPQWIKSIKEELKPAEPGLFQYKNSNTRFLLTTEISCIYSKKEKTRKIHLIVLSPSIEISEKINEELSKIGNLKSDGRPILGLDAKELVKIVLNISSDCMVIPAHCMTPWFGLFGSKSGFDSMEECFEELSSSIYAVETGLSADPSMLWRIPDLRNMALISNSDAHSPEKIGREANVFDTNLDYYSIINAIKTKKGFLETIEFYPQEGKYYGDGHRACNIYMDSKDSLRYNEICPICGKPLTVGVINRIEKLADKPEGFIPDNAIPFRSIVPLKEIIGEALGLGSGTKGVDAEYQKLIKAFKSEFNILLEIPFEELKEVVFSDIVEGIKRVREGKVNISPGFDGEYGKVKIFSEVEKREAIRQKTLF
ncbi:MAG TPA: endonuclease Q family protein [Candidatus Pacearchaeota archaeon]|mgnify:CR=1 FL=1|nr:endonuclease Q family protein [Candidatus Pacearchaeota archaeon]HPR79822.1 endonuclease Q family protein [Candidatus Pacearchaeota archaeon]